MHGSHWRLISLPVVVFTLVGLSACGSGTGEPVAQIANVGSISKATLDHWIGVEASLLYEEIPKKPAPKGVLPDPPRYDACIAYLESTQHSAGGSVRTTPVQLRAKCAERYRFLRVLTLNTLIGWEWIIGAGKELGLKVSEPEARKRLAAISLDRSLFATNAAYKSYLKWTHETISDMLFRSRVQLFEFKIQEKLSALQKIFAKRSGGQGQPAVTALMRELPPSKQWAAKTTCKRGFVTSACREYRGSESPGLPN